MIGSTSFELIACSTNISARDLRTLHLPRIHETGSTMHKHSCVSLPLVKQRALLYLVHTCFVSKSFSELSETVVQRQGRRTYRGIVVLWLQLFLSEGLVSAAWCLQVSEAGSDSAFAVLRSGLFSS